MCIFCEFKRETGEKRERGCMLSMSGCEIYCEGTLARKIIRCNGRVERKAQTSHFVFAAQFDIIVAHIASDWYLYASGCRCECSCSQTTIVTSDTFPVIFHVDAERVALRASENVIGLRIVMRGSFVWDFIPI